MRGMNFIDLLLDEDLQSTSNAMDFEAQERQTLKFRNKHSTKQGDSNHFDWTCTLHDGVLYGVAKDVSIEVKIEGELNKYKRFFDISQVNFCITDL